MVRTDYKPMPIVSLFNHRYVCNAIRHMCELHVSCRLHSKCELTISRILQTDVTTEGCSLISQQPSASPNCNYDVVIPHNKVVRRQTTVTVLPEEDPLLSPRKGLILIAYLSNR